MSNPIKVVVDASIFTRSSGSFGNVSGTIDLVCEPQIGDTLSFQVPKNKSVLPLPWFTGHSRVKDRVLGANGDPHGVLVMLEDIVVDTVANAQALVDFFQKGFGLFVNVFNEGDEPPQED